MTIDEAHHALSAKRFLRDAIIGLTATPSPVTSEQMLGRVVRVGDLSETEILAIDVTVGRDARPYQDLQEHLAENGDAKVVLPEELGKTALIRPQQGGEQ